MKILYLYQFFSTGSTPDNMRPFRLCRLLAEKGHNVVVIATNFSRHSGESEGPEEEIVETSGRPLRIIRVPSTKNYRRSLVSRFLNYATYSFRTLVKGMRISDVDLVLTSIPPTFVGPVGWLIAAVRHKPFVLEVRDLWPDALEVKGAVRNQVLLSMLYRMATFLYRRARLIVSLTYGIKEEIVRKGIPPQRIAVLPNGMDPELFMANQDVAAVRRRMEWGDDFVAVYVGTLVEVTAMDTVINAAEQLRDFPGIRFEIYGSGSTEHELARMIRAKGLTNCRLNGTVAKRDVPAILKAADACLMCLFETPLDHIYFQNKFFDYMGASRPIVAAMRGHQQEIIEHVGCGMCAAPGDSGKIADSLRYLAAHPDICREMGARGNRYACSFFSLDDILERYAVILTDCAAGLSPHEPVGSRPPLPGCENAG